MAENSSGTYVDTPGGKMTAGAMFYWNGSAWTGTGTPGTYVPTLGGPMQAMALFYWDGSAWVARSSLGI